MNTYKLKDRQQPTKLTLAHELQSNVKNHQMMLGMFSLPFVYNNKDYCALVRLKQNNTELRFEATVMNGDLEKKLFGHHIFKTLEDLIVPDIKAAVPQIAELQSIIIAGLTEYIKTDSFLEVYNNHEKAVAGYC